MPQFVDDDLAARALGRQLATLTLAVAAPNTEAHTTLAVACRNVLMRIGLEVPLCVVADLAFVLSGGAADLEPRLANAEKRVQRQGVELLGRFAALLRGLADIPAIRDLGRRALGPQTLAMVLARLMGDSGRVEARAAARGLVHELPIASPLYAMAPAELARRYDPTWVYEPLARLVQAREILLVRAEHLASGPLRLVNLFPAVEQGDLLELHRMMCSPEAARAIEVSLQLLPSILETRRTASAQSLALDGYASIERRGGLSTLLPSELAHDPDVFYHKALADELLYYGHERRAEQIVREHWVLIDASASMRGVRESFARGLGLVLGKKLHLQGDAVSLRLFDGRLQRRITLGAAVGRDLPYYYCFRAERGRHSARVFEEVLADARRVRARSVRALSITFITHGECHVPAGILESLTELASCYGIFVMPSRPLALPFLSLLGGYQTISPGDLASPEARKARGLAVVEDVARRRST